MYVLFYSTFQKSECSAVQAEQETMAHDQHLHASNHPRVRTQTHGETPRKSQGHFQYLTVLF